LLQGEFEKERLGEGRKGGGKEGSDVEGKQGHARGRATKKKGRTEEEKGGRVGRTEERGGEERWCKRVEKIVDRRDSTKPDTTTIKGNALLLLDSVAG
jgi:hypothetical protein